ncbi:uncharacterized protein A4U43_C07F13740 [Asparagus officinalis]|uniref:J domain-containing protein n=1 Tax=Asparagus officinalis TaxID=4686 RepID=A0A5P1EBQ6_ASPOF|nr:uncharacterized protein LOC109848417 [Asparagus officinalis]ONK63315.1 uncharacterized protein A4U43_C07F13740 [Asparagus officinalis]
MECNKEEAIRAKGIAEKRMLNKDFIGAQKIVLKAERLYPDLEHVSRMLTVCEVHCSAEVKVNGETDWYGILQVAPTADELTIKKQYRKLALLLHPDKNKFGGAEAAFKLVGEAHRILTERSKRVLHDMKRGSDLRTVSVRQPTQQANRTSSAKKQPGVTKSNGFEQKQSAASTSSQTFWTMCPSCGVRYQYYQTMINRAIRCQSCRKPFVAYEFNARGMPSAAASAHCPAQRGNLQTGSNEDVKVKWDGGTANDVKFENVTSHEMNNKEQARKSLAGFRSQKRGRKRKVESSESKSSDSDIVVDVDCPSGQNAGRTGSHPRRSTRQKQNISYSEEKGDDDDDGGDSDDDFVTPKNKKSRTGGTSVSVAQNDPKFWGGEANGVNKQSSGEAAHSIDGGLNAGACSKTDASVDFSSEISPDPDSFSYPDPEFYDFEKERDESKFDVDQIWAIYDTLDAMPRYYALIRHVAGPKFSLKFDWLEYDPTGKAETRCEGGLPIGCGSFKLGKSEQTKERLMFSHLMPWTKGANKNAYDIFPRKSEVWAVFKNWDIEWSSCVDSDRRYEYEIVEVVSDFTEGDVIRAIRLVWIQGFVSLFVQYTDNASSTLLKIQMKDILRFSHKIPSYRLKGNERGDIPKGSLELDTASLPHNFMQMLPSVTLENLKSRAPDLNDVCNGLHSKLTNTTNRNSSELNRVSVEELQKTHTDPEPLSTSPNWYEYPDSEFHNFDEERSIDKIEEGQIWAFYSDIDKNPKYYGRITKLETKNFKAHIAWLEGCCDQVQERLWYKEQLTVGCGTFKLVRDEDIMDSTDAFSHMVQAKPTNRKNYYIVYPNLGEIWAVYKNWSLRWSISDMENCEFDLVEILGVSSAGFKVMVLSKVNGYRAVFMGSPVIMEIPMADRLKFSHRIPDFRLTEERGGKLRGYWELDPASVPDILLFADSS